MEVAKEIDNGIAVCKITGEININSSTQLRGLFDELINQGQKKVIVDFSGLDYIDSAGLAVMIELLQRLQRASGVLRLCALNKRIKSIFEVTKLSNIFSIHDNIDSAKQGFK